MKQLKRWLISVPIVLIATLLAIANRHVVTFSLDPFSTDAPVASISLPLYAIIFIAIFAGTLFGGSSAWLAAGRTRAARRQLKRELKAAEKDRAKAPLPPATRT